MRALLTICLLLCTGCSTSGEPLPYIDSSATNEDVTTASENFLTAFDNMDWDPFIATWSTSSTVFFPASEVPGLVVGRADVERHFKDLFDEIRTSMPGPPYLNLQPEQLTVQQFSDSAVVTFMLGKGARPARRTLVFVKEGGKWKLAHLHASNGEL